MCGVYCDVLLWHSSASHQYILILLYITLKEKPSFRIGYIGSDYSVLGQGELNVREGRIGCGWQIIIES